MCTIILVYQMSRPEQTQKTEHVGCISRSRSSATISGMFPCPLPSTHYAPAIAPYSSASSLRGHEVRPDWRQRLLSRHDSLACRSWLGANLKHEVLLCNDLQCSQGYFKDQTPRLMRKETSGKPPVFFLPTPTAPKI